MAIISNGRLVLEGAPDEALERLRGGIYSILVNTEEEFGAVSAQYRCFQPNCSAARTKYVSTPTPRPAMASVRSTQRLRMSTSLR